MMLFIVRATLMSIAAVVGCWRGPEPAEPVAEAASPGEWHERPSVAPIEVEGPDLTTASAPTTTNATGLAFMHQGMQQVNAGLAVDALASFEAAVACEPDPYFVQLAFMSACTALDSSKAKRYYEQLSPAAQAKFAQVCIRLRVAYR